MSDAHSRLLGEYTTTTDRDDIFLGDLPVANVDTAGSVSTIAYVTADGLGTPRAVADASGNLIWSLPDQGNVWNEVAPISVSGYVENRRFPGQYFDAETGLSQNVHRDYEAGTGRYVQSDPMGLFGGQGGTYAYVDGEPLDATDYLGLKDYLEKCVGRYKGCAYSQYDDAWTITNWLHFKSCKYSIDSAIKRSGSGGKVAACDAELNDCQCEPKGWVAADGDWHESERIGKCNYEYDVCVMRASK